jgi:Bacterial PH domain
MWRAPHVDPIGVVFSLVFVAAGLYLVVGRFFVEARQRARTFYAVTNERIIIVSGMRSQTMKSIDLKTLGEIALSERRNGSGTIIFGPTSPFDWMPMPSWPGMGSRMAARFEVIPDVRPVYETIRKVQRALST